MIDVCLLLEGSYPFVAGGVATWVHQLISSMKDLKFGIVTITAFPDPTRTPKYDMPAHVVYFKEICLHDYAVHDAARRSPKMGDWELLKDFYDGLTRRDYSKFGSFISLFQGENTCLDMDRFFISKQVWNYLLDYYERFGANISFLDFFWTWRATHLPLLNIFRSELPQASIYHAISTGYAGLMGAIAKERQGGRFFLTEHGIYTHERMLEISQANWIFEQQHRFYKAQRELPFFKRWWIQIFKVMSQIAYDKSDRIFTLFEGNKIKEISDGALSEKITIIPNGIDVRKLTGIKRKKKVNPQIGLIGRVVSIKDIKTFIEAARRVLAVMPQAEFYIIGPTDEEEDYYEECRLMVESLGIENSLQFTGRVDVSEYYQFLDVVVLTSLSEAQPYVILEANIIGIPVVATDVGACREMLEGINDEDKQIGASGLVVEVSNAQASAEAIIQLIENKQMYEKMSEAGHRRVKAYYDQDDLLSRYLNAYEQAL